VQKTAARQQDVITRSVFSVSTMLE